LSIAQTSNMHDVSGAGSVSNGSSYSLLVGKLPRHCIVPPFDPNNGQHPTQVFPKQY